MPNIKTNHYEEQFIQKIRRAFFGLHIIYGLHDNALYDIELTTETNRFGPFFVPELFENTVVAGAYPDITIKDCGSNNSITGGIWIDTVAEPCN